ncbi:MAG: GTP-binding protein [Leptospiraceae bacterium]|nr:GTP-binding protein [Leptospiraceae bacterium]MCP5511417.1 GTP-binding protein [Leptospiraceae bacterium]
MIRNIGIFAHIDAGKTTFVERILYETGELSSPGSVEEGTTEMDSLPEEISRGISITASTTQVKYKYKKETYLINLIDTPGHLDFYSQVDAALMAVDIAILLIDVTAGIRSQTELIANKISHLKIPILIFLNKIDRTHDIEILQKDLKRLFDFPSVKVYYFDEEDRLRYTLTEKEINEDLELSYIEWSEPLTDKYFKSKTPKKILLSGLKDGLIQKKLIPVFAGSGLYGEGVRELLDLICSLKTESEEKNFDAQLFKKQIHPYLGRISYLKLYSELKIGDFLYHNEVACPITKIICLIPGGVHELRSAEKNSIIVIPTPEGEESETWRIGDFFWLDPPLEDEDRKFSARLNYKREFAVALEPEKEEFRSELNHSLRDLVWEDPGLSHRIRSDTGQLELLGMGELHLDVSLKRLTSFIGEKFLKREIRVARYQIFTGEKEKVYWKHSANEGQFQSLGLTVSLLKSKSFENKVNFQTKISKSHMQSIESSVMEFLSHGPDGMAVYGVKLEVHSVEDFHSDPMHTLGLTKVAILQGLKSELDGNLKTIGPISLFEILVPFSSVGTVISILNKRKAKVIGMDVVNDRTRIHGEASAESLLGFFASLRNLTQGKGSLTLETHFNENKYSSLDEKESLLPG